VAEPTTTETVTADIGDVIRCQNCGSQTRSISRDCSNCGHGRTTGGQPTETVTITDEAHFRLVPVRQQWVEIGDDDDE